MENASCNNNNNYYYYNNYSSSSNNNNNNSSSSNNNNNNNNKTGVYLITCANLLDHSIRFICAFFRTTLLLFCF